MLLENMLKIHHHNSKQVNGGIWFVGEMEIICHYGVNGTLVASTTTTGYTPSGTPAIGYFRNYDNSEDLHTDEFKWWNVSLSDEQIDLIYEREFAGVRYDNTSAPISDTENPSVEINSPLNQTYNISSN